MLMSPVWFLPFGFSDQNFVCISHLSYTSYMRSQYNSPWPDHPNNICWSVQVMKLLIMQSSPASRHFLHLRSKYSLQHPVSEHHQSSLTVTDQISHPYKTEGKIMVFVYFNL
jgi:hypothetical protein